MSPDLSRLLSHPITNVFPRMTPHEFDEFKEDIRQNGVLMPIVLIDGKIIDGRHRAQACEELHLEPPVIEIADDPLAVAHSLNVRRRHLSPDQIAAIFKRLQADYPRLAAKITEFKTQAAAARSNNLKRGASRCRPGRHRGERRPPRPR
jgi:ParB-like chromosome segregation protein Spo0J